MSCTTPPQQAATHVLQPCHQSLSMNLALYLHRCILHTTKLHDTCLQELTTYPLAP